MARVETFTYGTFVVGGAAQTVPSEWRDRYSLEEGWDSATFTVDFLVTGATPSALAANCALVEDALRTPRLRLSVTLGGATMVLFDPDPTAVTGPGTGFDATPTLTKLEEGATGKARFYRWSVRYGLPMNFAGQAGRRVSTTALHFDKDARRVVTISGQYTEIPPNYSRPQFNSVVDAFCASRLALIVPTGEWVLGVREPEADNDSKSTLDFSRQYLEVVDGRRGSTVEVDTLASGLRLVTLRGTYLSTGNTTTTGPTVTASANYAAFEPAHSAAVLAALTPPLVFDPSDPDSNCELSSETATPNEQDDRLDYVRVYRELRVAQSSAAVGLEDANVIDDQITFAIARYALDDSPIPTTSQLSSPPGATPNGSAAASQAAQGVPGGSGSQPVQASPPGGGGQTVERGTTTSVRKLVDLAVGYQATIKATVPNLQVYWDAFLFPFLVNQIASRLGLSAIQVGKYEASFDTQTSSIKAQFVCRGLESSVLAYRETNKIHYELGERLDRVYDGNPNAYLRQQTLVRATKQRTVTTIYVTGGAFTINSVRGQSQAPGWVMTTVDPEAVDLVQGIAGLAGVPTLAVTMASFVETYTWVGSLAARAAGGGAAVSVKTPAGA